MNDIELYLKPSGGCDGCIFHEETLTRGCYCNVSHANVEKHFPCYFTDASIEKSFIYVIRHKLTQQELSLEQIRNLP